LIEKRDAAQLVDMFDERSTIETPRRPAPNALGGSEERAVVDPR
jgi:hypothetical protein